MNQTTPPNGRKRHAWLAAALSILVPGLGQVYCGKLLRGLALGLAYGVAIPVVLGLLAYHGPASTIVFAFLMIAATFGVLVVATIDACRLARRTRTDYSPKPYNGPGLYVLLALMIQGSSLGYALHVRGSLFEAFRVPAASVYPNIVPNDRILVDKTAYRKADPQRGDLVLFKPPTEHWRTHYIKRVVALPGDTVSMQQGSLHVNGRKLPLEPVEHAAVNAPQVEINGRVLDGAFSLEQNGSSEYVIFVDTHNHRPGLDFPELTVPEHHCFVLGDNRNHSLDSRHFGPLPFAAIAGRADYVYWPTQKWSRFGRLR
jgi:signal peptidase I